MKKILFFNPYGIYPIHFETDLELIKKHLDNNDQVTYLSCNGELLSCQANPHHRLSRCADCIERRKKGFDLLRITDQITFLPWKNVSGQEEENIQQQLLQSINSRADLLRVEIQKCDIGRSVLSSLIDVTSEPYPDIKKSQDFIKKNIRVALEVYFSIKHHLLAESYDIFYMFNGRSAIMRPALRAAQEIGTQTFVHERAGSMGKYTLTENEYPHNLGLQKQRLLSIWNESSHAQEKKVKVASSWFQSRTAGKDQGWFSFTKNQNQELPTQFNPNKVNIAIFNSSEHEVATIPGWENPIYKDQNDGITQIAQSLESNVEIELYLRIHPNLKHRNNSQTRYLKSLKSKFKNLHVIDAHQSTSTYKLLEACDCALTFGSTIGVEAAFSGKPSILVGRSLYEDLDVCFKPNSHESLINFIQQKKFLLNASQLAERRQNAMVYGYYMATYGILFEFFKQEGVIDISYQGQYITTKPRSLVLAVRKIRSLINRLKDIIA